MSRQLAEMLLKDRIITHGQFDEASLAVTVGKGSFVRFLINKKYLAETKLLYYLSQKFGLPSINLSKFEVNPDVLRLISPDVAKKHQTIPIQSNRGTLVVAVCDPTVITSSVEEIKFRT